MGVKSLILTLLVISLVWRCERLTQPKVTDKVECRLEPVAALVTDAYWRLEVSDRPEGSELWVYRDEVLWQRKALTVGDSLFHDEGLPPGSRVRYRVEVRKEGVVIGRSNSLEMSLLDTTSHAVQWQVYEFDSQGGSGYFLDVAIVSEDDIWVVGKLNSYYSLVNAVHWDGQRWEEKRIQFKGRCIAVEIPPIFCVTVFQNRLYFSNGGAITRLQKDGFLETDCKVNDVITGNIKEIFFYKQNGNPYMGVIGNKGNVCLKIPNWKKLDYETPYNIQDVYVDDKGNESNILAIASDFYHRPGSELISIEESRVSVISDSSTLTRGFAGLWFRSGKEYWLVGDGVYRSRLTPHNWKVEQSFPRYFSHAIAGTDVNDVWVVGAYGLVSHYNGRSWHHYGGAELPPHGVLEKVAVTQKVVVAVGTIGGKGLIIMGKR